MTKDVLKQYRSLKREIRELDTAIDSYKTHATVKSSRDFPYCQRTVTVRGSQASKEKYRLHERKVECHKQCEEIEKFIDLISDSLLRRIFTYRYITGSNPMGWQRVSREIGGGNTAEGVRKRVYRYLSSQK